MARRRTVSRKMESSPPSSDLEDEDERVIVSVKEEEDEEIVEKNSKNNKRKKKKADDSKPRKKKSATTSSSTVGSSTTTTEETISEATVADTKEEEEIEFSLDSIKSDNELVMQSVDHFNQSINFLDSIERNYASLPVSERQTMRNILNILHKKVGKLFDLCKSAELLLFRGVNHDMSEYGLLNTIQLPEIWATIFSFLNFSDFLKASQVCKTWQTASLQPHALSCFHLNYGVNSSAVKYLEIFKKYIAWRIENIQAVWNIPSRLMKWIETNDIAFPNAKFKDVNYSICWEESPNQIMDIKLCEIFPKYSKKVHESDFDSYVSFYKREDSVKKIPANTNIAKLVGGDVVFEDPESIEELVIHKWKGDFPQFENLQILDLSQQMKFSGAPEWTFNSTKLTKLCITYSSTLEEVESLVPHFINIKSLKLVDGGTSKSFPCVTFHLKSFKNLTELEIETLTESDLTKVPPSLRRLKIGRIVEKNSKIIHLLSNIEELHTTEQVLSHINLIRLPKLKTLLISNNTSNHNKQMTIESTTIENLSLLTYNSITIKCPNLYYLKVGPGLKGGSDSIYIKSNQLTNFILEREVQMLSIQGPNFVSDGSILAKVKNIIDLECPLIDRAFVNSLSSIEQGDSFRTLLTKQIKTLTISVTYFELFGIKTEIQHLNIQNWKSNQIISASKLDVYRNNVKNIRTLTIFSCSTEVVKFLNSIFKDSTSLESLSIEDTNYDTEYFDTLSNPVYYPNLRSLSLRNITSFKPQIGAQFLKTLDKRPLLNRIGVHYKSSYKKMCPTYIPIHCNYFTGQLSGCSNNETLPNLTNLAIVSGGISYIDYSSFKLFPNLKSISFYQVPFSPVDPMLGSETILDYCKHLETVVAPWEFPKEFYEHKGVTVLAFAF